MPLLDTREISEPGAASGVSGSALRSVGSPAQPDHPAAGEDCARLLALNDTIALAPSAVAYLGLADWHAGFDGGLRLNVDDEPSASLRPAQLIAIDFPAFLDGRGLSLAVLLRTRFDYCGELRAVGDVHPELLHYLKRCGFDSCVIPSGRPLPGPDAGPCVFAPYSDYYQASALEPIPVYRRIRRGA